MENKDLRKFFDQKPDLFNEAAPHSAWDRLDSGLNFQKRTKKRTTLKLIRTLSIAASLVGVLMITTFLVLNLNAKQEDFANDVVFELVEVDFGNTEREARLTYDKIIEEGQVGRVLIPKKDKAKYQRKLIYRPTKE